MKAWVRAFASVLLPSLGIAVSLFELASRTEPDESLGLVALVPFALFMAAFFAHTWGEVLFSSLMTGVVFRVVQLWLAGLGARGFHELSPGPFLFELTLVLALALPGLIGGWLARMIRRARGFPEPAPGLAPLRRQLVCLVGTWFAFAVLSWFSLASEVRGVFTSRCSDDPQVSARAADAQAALWGAVENDRVTDLELRFLFSSRFCGSPQRTLCTTFLQAGESTRHPERFGVIASSVADACQTDRPPSFGGGG